MFKQLIQLAIILLSTAVALAGCGRFPRAAGASAGRVIASPPAGVQPPPNPTRELLFDGFEGETVARFWLPGNYGSGLYVPGAVVISRDYARSGTRSVRMTVKEGDIRQPGGDGHDT